MNDRVVRIAPDQEIQFERRIKMKRRIGSLASPLANAVGATGFRKRVVAATMRRNDTHRSVEIPSDVMSFAEAVSRAPW
jgi:hypothetical protein